MRYLKVQIQDAVNGHFNLAQLAGRNMNENRVQRDSMVIQNFAKNHNLAIDY